MEEAKTKYVAVQYDEATQRKLRAWAKENGFDLETKYDGTKQDEKDFDFHTTIFFTTSKHNIPNHVKTIAPSGTAKVVDIMMLGVNNDIPVLKIDSMMVLRIRKHYQDAYGMEDQWPEYKPHVSISYSKDLPDMSKVKLPTFELTFNEIKVDDGNEF
jgi:2'-5' RNA ligase